MGEGKRIGLAKKYLQAAWGGDFATFDALTTPDAVFIDSAGDRLEGFAECSAAARAFHRLEPNCRLEIREAFERGDAVLLRVDLLAKNPRLRGRYLISVASATGGSTNGRPIATSRLPIRAYCDGRAWKSAEWGARSWKTEGVATAERVPLCC